jgi:translation initiation factor 3 subunit C
MRSQLCNVYHLAIQDQYQHARAMMLMSHAQETIHQFDISTQTLFNRALVQIGLCAFRCGLFRDAHTTLQEIFSSGKIKELLAQGVSTANREKTVEQEKLEKTKQLPFHMHISLELVECAYLVSAMLLEIPNIALNAYDSRRKVISKAFRRMLEYSDRQAFTGPPENTRDHIVAAAKAMSTGNWKTATSYIHSINVWSMLPNAEKVKEMTAT